MSRRINLLNCGYAAGAAAAGGAGTFSFVSLFNNDNLGRYLAVWDVGRLSLETVNTGYLIQNKQIGSSAVTPSPLVTNQPTPTGQLTTGAAAALPTMSMLNSMQEPGNVWAHDFPLVVLAQGWSITIYHGTANIAFVASFIFELLDAADLMGIEPPRPLVLPSTITLQLEAK